MTRSPEFFNTEDQINLPGTLGIRSLELGPSHSLVEMEIQRHHMNLRGFIHGGSVVTLADTAAGYGTFHNLPNDAEGFTTMELKTNFLRAVQSGKLLCRADCVHQGKTTQVWDARVTDGDNGKQVALFRCTQLIIYSNS